MPKILVIDDSAFHRQYVRGFLEEAGYEVEDFHPGSALEVLEKAKLFQPDLVLTDYVMPHVDGLTVVKMIRHYSAATPVVILSAFRDPRRDEKLKIHQPLWILNKPIKGDTLVAALKPILAP